MHDLTYMVVVPDIVGIKKENDSPPSTIERGVARTSRPFQETVMKESGPDIAIELVPRQDDIAIVHYDNMLDRNIIALPRDGLAGFLQEAVKR